MDKKGKKQNIRAEINSTETRKTIEKVKSKSGSLRRSIKVIHLCIDGSGKKKKRHKLPMSGVREGASWTPSRGSASREKEGMGMSKCCS